MPTPFEHLILPFALGMSADGYASDPEFLDEMAAAGGTTSAYWAVTPDALVAALDEIAGGLLAPPCTYRLAEEPPVPSDVTVLFDCEAIPRDLSNTDGWNYGDDDRTVVFYGSYCESVRKGSVDRIDFLYGCPGPVIE